MAGKRIAWLAGGPVTPFANVHSRADALVGCCPGRRSATDLFYRPTTHPNGFAPMSFRGSNPVIFLSVPDTDVPDPAACMAFARIKPHTAGQEVRAGGDRRSQGTWGNRVSAGKELRTSPGYVSDTAELWLSSGLPCRVC